MGDEVELPANLTRYESHIIDSAARTRGICHQNCRSAIRHIALAERLQDVDAEMSVFRAITAEEEAATAIFQSLKKRRYSGAKRLNHRSHLHKNALIPFIAGAQAPLGPQISDAGFRVALRANTDSDTSYVVEVLVTHPELLPGKGIIPVPPLEVRVSDGDGGPDFTLDVSAVDPEAASESVQQYLAARANLRNRLLYSSDEGIPRVEGHEGRVRMTRDHVFALLSIFLLIDQESSQQSLVQQLLDAFLETLGLVEPSAKDLDFA